MFLALFFLYIFLIINSVYSFFFIVENESEGFVRSVLFIKFILLVFAFSTLIEKDKILTKIKINWLIVTLVVIIDIFYEKYFGKNRMYEI